MGGNITLNPESHSIPSYMSALSPKVLKTEDFVAACGRVIPRWDRSIFALWLYVISFPFGIAAVISCVVGCLSVHGQFVPM